MNKIQSLNGIWELHKDGEEGLRIPAAVPGSVLQAMLDQGMIEDPYWRCREYQVRELMTADYIYEREFEAEDLDADSVELVCEGLDTIAQVVLNGTAAASVDDMHRTFCIPVKHLLKPGTNHIAVRFSSALTAARHEDGCNDIFYASTGCIHGNAAIRKAHYMFGWDWGPQLIDAGIHRAVSLVYTRQPGFDDVLIRQTHRPDGSVMLSLHTMLYGMEKYGNEEEPLWITVTVTQPDGSCITKHCRYEDRISCDIREPKLWWPNGVGAHPLYLVEASLERQNGEIYDRCRKRIGLRTVEVCTEPHEHGSEFAFAVNGVRIFAMGGNYIPEDTLLSRVTKERTKRLIQDCKQANFNCIRVWGGGYYPDEFFYDACDEAGILVWQDLMFACNVYELNDHFEENITEETRDNVRRIRHHPCLALWCGNNEMEWGWGEEWARLKGHHPKYKADYTKLFEYILPKVLKSCDDVTCYWPSSPSSGGSFDEPNAVNRGDQHYWDVWHSGKPFTEYRREFFSFCSEYGFQSFPCMKTIRSFTLPEDRNIFSEVMESHQKNGAANGKILNYVADYFLYPKSLGDLAYISQVLQLKAVQYGVEHWRRNRGRCMGSLYWQINDCWPVASWSGIDYYGRWKALHYGARRFYAPVMVSACEEEELSTRIGYYVHNDTLRPVTGSVEVSLIDGDLNVLWEHQEEITVPPMSVKSSLEVDYQDVIPVSKGRGEVLARVRFRVDGLCVSEQVSLFVKPKHFRYGKPIYQVLVSEAERCFEITVKSLVFAQYVELDLEDLDGVFTDNYFDITSPLGVTVSLPKSELPKGICLEDLKKQIRVRSVSDSYEMG